MEQNTVEGTIAKLESEVQALKSAQPFYNGQLKLKLIPKSSSPYDYTVTPSTNSYAVSYRIFNSPIRQANAMMKSYLQIFDASMNETYVGVANPEIRYLQYPTDPPPDRILFTFANLSGQTRYLKVWTLSTDEITFVSDELVLG